MRDKLGPTSVWVSVVMYTFGFVVVVQYLLSTCMVHYELSFLHVYSVITAALQIIHCTCTLITLCFYMYAAIHGKAPEIITTLI